jgi:cellulose synthase/poly-beta-1,6-N-acetylglucosamine synthase-like glycosyltransferase
VEYIKEFTNIYCVSNLPKVMIGVPTNDEKNYCLSKFLVGLQGIEYPNLRILFTDDSERDEHMTMLGAAGFEIYNVPETKGDEDWRQRVCNARNLIRKKFLESDCDYLLFIDSDVVCPTDVVYKMLNIFEKNKDCTMACGIYFFYSHDRIVPVAFPYFAPEFKHLHNLFANFETQPLLPTCPEYLNLFPSRIMKINSSGMGCNMISREAVEKFGEFYFKPEFISTEDLWYCLDMNNGGGAIYADTGCVCIHYPTNKSHYAPGFLEKY